MRLKKLTSSPHSLVIRPCVSGQNMLILQGAANLSSCIDAGRVWCKLLHTTEHSLSKLIAYLKIEWSNIRCTVVVFLHGHNVNLQVNM